MYCYYCLHRFRWPPHIFNEMPVREKALVMAMIDHRIKEEQREMKRMKTLKR